MPDPVRDQEFARFVTAHRVALLRSACLLTAGDVHLAEDLVQTALARLYVAWPRMRGADPPLAYVRRIVINAYLDERARPRWSRERVVSELPDVPDPRPGPDSEGITGAEVRAALAELPARMRAAAVLRYWVDLSVEETADLLGCSTGTVKSQAAKASARLRELLRPQASETSGKSPDGHPRLTPQERRIR